MGNRRAIVYRLLTEPRLSCVRDRDSYGFTPLMYAAMKSRSVDIIRAIIADGYEGVLTPSTPAVLNCCCLKGTAQRHTNGRLDQYGKVYSLNGIGGERVKIVFDVLLSVFAIKNLSSVVTFVRRGPTQYTRS